MINDLFRTYFMVSEDAVAKRNWINELTEVLREGDFFFLIIYYFIQFFMK